MSPPQSPESLHAVVKQLAKDHPDRLAVDGLDGDPWSYGKLYANSLRMASVLRSQLDGSAGYSLSIGLCAPRGPRWVAVCVAASMLGVPFVPMVQDLHPNTKSEAEAKKIRDTTDDRNRAIMQDIQPMVVVVDEATTPKETIELVSSFGQSTVIDINSLLDEATCTFFEAIEPLQPVQRESPLCLLFTGGTTKASKCAVVSQGMLAHEFKSYPLIVPTSQRDHLMCGKGPRVLQQSSSYWGATCIGQLSLSLALRGCLVMVDVSSKSSLSISSTMDLRSMITKFAINVVGAVPSQLAATTLDEDVAKSLLAVFTWGEKLTTTIGDEWSSKIPIVIELLVATEYWLTMYRVVTPYSTAGPLFTVVPGVRVTTLSEDEVSTDITKGELILAGPSVTETGYVEEVENEGLFVEVGGRRFFRTKDLIEVVEWRAEAEGCAETLRYLGRSDMFIKLGGQWVDLEVLQEKISTLPCVKEVVLLQQQPKVSEASTTRGDGETLGGLKLEDDTEKPSVHAFIIMKPFRMATMADVQRLLPSGNVVQVHWLALQALPRHTATGKVDRRALLGTIPDDDLPLPSHVELKRCRGYLARWSLITAVIAIIHYLLLGLSGMILAAHLNITYWTLKMVHGNIWRILEHAKPPYIADEPGLRWALRSALDWIFSLIRAAATELKDVEIWIKSRACSIGGILVSLSLTWLFTFLMGVISDSMVWSVAWQSVVFLGSGLLLDTAFPPLDRPYKSLSLWYRICHGLVLVVQFNVLWWLSIGRSIEKDSSNVTEWTSDPGASWWVPSWLRDCSLDIDQATSAALGSSSRPKAEGDEEFLMDSVFVSPRDLRHCRDREEVVEGMFDQRSGWTTSDGKAGDGYEESYYYSWMDTTDGRRHRGLPPTVQITTKEWSEMRKDALNNIDKWWEEVDELDSFDEDVIDGESYHVAKENLHYEERRHLSSREQSTPITQQLEVSETSTTPTLGARDDDDSSTDDDEWYVSGNDDTTATNVTTVEVEAPEVEKNSKVGGGTGSLAQRLALLVEKQLSYPIDDYDADVVSSIDSLGAVQLAHSIRTELRLTGLLSVGDVLKCRTINDLVAVVDGKSKTIEDTIDNNYDTSSSPLNRLSKVLDAVTGINPKGDGPKSAGLPVQVWGWQGVCAWMLEWTKGDGEDINDDEVDLVALQMAIQAVVARQASMRVTTDVGITYFTFMNECLSVQGLVKYMALTRGGRWLSWIADVAYGIGRWVLWPLWGRIHLSPAVEGRPGAVRVREFTSRETLRRWIQSEKRQSFHSPLAMDIVLLDESYDGCGPVRTFVRVFVTHAFSDGFSVVPLLSDLNEAYVTARKGRHRGPRHRLLPPLRTSGPQVQSSRLRHTLFDRARDVHGDTLYPCYTIDHTTVSHYSNGFGHCVKLLPSIHLTLHSIARKLGAPVDVVMLAAIVLASVRERGWRKVAKATLVVPLRDGPTEHQLVGLFADLRNVDIPLEDIPGDTIKPCASSVLNFVLTLRRMIKFRRWTIPTPLSSCERMLVNLLPAQFPSGGEGRFEQNLHVSPLPQGSSVTATRAMEIACDQTSRDSWALRFKCREPDYSRDDLCNWLDHFHGAIRDMVVDPMRPLYH